MAKPKDQPTKSISSPCVMAGTGRAKVSLTFTKTSTERTSRSAKLAYRLAADPRSDRHRDPNARIDPRDAGPDPIAARPGPEIGVARLSRGVWCRAKQQQDPGMWGKIPANQPWAKELGVCGGGGGIRTHGRLSPTSVFKTGAFNHSATPPTTRRHNVSGLIRKGQKLRPGSARPLRNTFIFNT